MEQIQIYHEAPLQIFDKVQSVTDGDYALVHLLDRDEAYAAHFMKAKFGDKRPVILDNSAYELGKAFEADDFATWIDILEPDVYVVPDVMGEFTDTVDSFVDWTRQYNFPGKKMGVLQGKTPQEAVNCFKKLKHLGADIIGIPFLVGKGFVEPDEKVTPVTLMAARISLISKINEACDAHPIHLLGVGLPQEGRYSKRCPWVVSIDTSNPVVHGLFGISYGYNGLEEKRSELLANLIHIEVDSQQEATIFKNIEIFKELWTRHEGDV